VIDRGDGRSLFSTPATVVGRALAKNLLVLLEFDATAAATGSARSLGCLTSIRLRSGSFLRGTSGAAATTGDAADIVEFFDFQVLVLPSGLATICGACAHVIQLLVGINNVNTAELLLFAAFLLLGALNSVVGV
jgi:prepilin signal peptidase PulO-like enzyme (type II secretory pathway)